MVRCDKPQGIAVTSRKRNPHPYIFCCPSTIPIAALEQQRRTMEQTADDIGGFMFEVTELQEPVQRFDDALWRAMVDRVLIKPDGSMVFRFYGGIEVAS